MSVIGLPLGITASGTAVVEGLSINAEGNAQVDTAVKKYGTGSVEFDGTGDYLDVPSGLAIAGSGEDFTIEAWVYFDSLTGGQGIFTDRPPTTSGYSSTNFYVEKNSSNTIFCGFSGGGDITGTSSVSASQWYHMAFVRSSGTTSFYLDGQQTGSTLSYTGAVDDGSFSMGAVVGQYLNGYMDEIRVSSVARYTADFTPPQSTFQYDSDTLLLLHCDGTSGSTTFDADESGAARTAIDLDTVNAQSEIDTAQKKFGSSSSLHTGNGSLVRYTGSNAGPFYQRGGAMTVECFFKVNSDTGSATVGIVTLGTNNATVARACSLMWRNFDRKFQAVYYPQYDSGNQQIIWSGTGMSAVSLPSGFIHLAMAWNGSQFSVWVDGTRYHNVALTSSTGTIGTNGNLDISNNLNVSDDAWVDEVRISSVDRYGVTNSSITVPTDPFVNDSDTLALHHFEGTDGSQSGAGFEDDNG